MDDELRRAQQRMTDATAEMMSGWLNQMFEGLRDDPVIGELWSAMKAETRSRHQAVVDPYRVIGLDKTSADDQVKKRYRDLMVKLHPDTAGVKGTEFLFQLVMAAYQQIAKERGWR